MKYYHMEFITVNINNKSEKLIKNKNYMVLLSKENFVTNLMLTDIFWDDGIIYIKTVYNNSKYIKVEEKITLLVLNTRINLGIWKIMHQESKDQIYHERIATTKYDTTDLEKYLEEMNGISLPNKDYRGYKHYDVGKPDWNILFKYHQSNRFTSSGGNFHKIAKMGHIYKHNIWITTHSSDYLLTKNDTYHSIFYSINAIGISPNSILETLKSFEENKSN